MVAAANRFLSKLFLLSKSNLGRDLLHSGTIRKIHVTMASAATATWLANEFILEKTAWVMAGAGIEPATRGFSVHCSAN